MADEVKQYRRVTKEYLGDSEGREITMMTDLDTGETKFIGTWTFTAKMSDGQGNIFEQPDPHSFGIKVEGEGKSTERKLKAFDNFDVAKQMCLDEMNAKNATRIKIVKAG